MPEHSTLPSPIGRYQGKAVSEATCLNANEVLAFVQGLLEAEQLARLHAHLDACETCQKLVNEAAHALTSTPGVENDPGDRTTFQKSDVVGQRYLILRFIAKGGMGEVYEAYDRTLRERVALKTVTSSVSQSGHAVRRLKVEAQLARRVSHPNVCRIYDVGTHVIESTSTTIHFLTMELVEGESLGARLRSSGAIPVPDAQKIARQLLLGLSAAHHAGILHRDFKSDNVMLRAEANGELSALIMDFGLARALGRDTALTTGRNQGLVGTIAYMSPEQIENRPLTPASDIYSFGVAWFETLTGKLPFLASTAAWTALERFRRAPPAPSSINPQVSKSLDAIVLRCLGRRPEDRFATADDVLEALASYDRALGRSRHSAPARLARIGVLSGVLGAVAYGLFSLLPAHPAASRVLPGKVEARIENPPPFRPQPDDPARAAPGEEVRPGPGEAKETNAPRRVKEPAHAGPAPVRSPPTSPETKAEASDTPSTPAPVVSTRLSDDAPSPPSETDAKETSGKQGRPDQSPARRRRSKPDWEDPFRDLSVSSVVSHPEADGGASQNTTE
jgi:serine/threonine protein kinase